MRTLASRLGVRASSLYRHFPDRSAIENTLAGRAAQQLLDCMEQATQNLQGERAVFAASRAYVDYASSEPSFYDILMQCASPLSPPSDVTKPLWKFLVLQVSDMTQVENDVSGGAALWSFLHGFAVLSRSGQWDENVSNLTLARGTQALIRGLSAPRLEVMRAPS